MHRNRCLLPTPEHFTARRYSHRYSKVVKSKTPSGINILYYPTVTYLPPARNPPPSIQLRPNLPHPPQPPRSRQKNQDHHRKQSPEHSAIPRHECIRGRRIEILLCGRYGFRDDGCDGQTDGRAELGAGVEDCAAEGLGAEGEDGGDDEEADGEEDVGAEELEDL